MVTAVRILFALQLMVFLSLSLRWLAIELDKIQFSVALSGTTVSVKAWLGQNLNQTVEHDRCQTMAGFV